MWLSVVFLIVQDVGLCGESVPQKVLAPHPAYAAAIFTSLAKEVMFLVALVCLSVCLSVDNITQKDMNGLGWNFMEGSWVVQWRTDYVLVVIWVF